MNYTDGYHGGRDESGRIMAVCIMADLINHAPTDESRFEGNTKSLPFHGQPLRLLSGKAGLMFYVRCAVSFLSSDFSRQAFYLVYILKGRINWIRRGATRFIPYRADSLGLPLAIGREVPLGGTEESIP